MGVPLYLMEMNYLNPSTMETVTLRFSSGAGGYTTFPSDSPANAFYEPRVKVPNNWQASVFRDGLTGGGANGGYGTAQLFNHDGYFDQFMGMAWDGQTVRLLYGDSDAAYSDFAVLLTGTMAQPEFTLDYMNVKVRDYGKLFEKAISQFVYLGNNVAGVGIEGTPDDLMGKTKPLCFGHCLNVSPSLVSQSAMMYQVHNGAIAGVDAVYSDGDAMEPTADYDTHYELATAAGVLSGGKFATCLAEGLFSIGGGVSSGITADVRGCALGGQYVDTVPGIIRRIAEHYIRRPRINQIQYSEDFDNAAWEVSGLTKGVVASNGSFAGMMPLIEDASTGAHTLSQTLALGTGMWCFSIPVTPAGRSLVRLELSNSTTSVNNCLVDFNLATGDVLLKQANGAAVGPQYTATGFITDGGVIVDGRTGALRIWVAGQPDQAFTQITASLSLLSGAANSYAASYAGDGASGVYVGAPALGAQIEAYRSPSIYTGPTTTTPVTGYDPATGPVVNAASFAALEALGTAGAEVGYYVAAGETTTAASVMSDLAASVGCWWAFNRAGEMVIGQLSRPSADAVPVATINQDVPGDPPDIIQDSVNRVSPYNSTDGTVAYRIVLQCVRNWTVQNKSSVASVLWTSNPTWVCWLGLEWREIRAEDLTTLAAHPLACELSFTAFMVKQSDALAECKRLLVYYGQRLDRFSFKTKFENAKNVNIGDIVSINIPRFGLSGGKNFVVISLTEVHELGQATIEVIG